MDYHYFGNRFINVNGVRDGSSDSPPTISTGAPLQPLNDNKNPLFNFDSNFFQKFESVSTLDLASSVPYISLSSIDLNGQVVDNFNTLFFHRTIDFDAFNTQEKHPDRPEMSLKNVVIRSNLASGYLYFTEVIVNLKIHKITESVSGKLMSLLFPGIPLRLEYGWNCQTNTFLDEKEILFFSIKNYTMSLDATGQIDLSLVGMAFNEKFNNALVGDIGTELQSSDFKEQGGENILNQAQIGGLAHTKQQIEQTLSYLTQLRDRPNNNGVLDISLVSSYAEAYQSLEKRATGKIKQKFNELYRQLSTLKKTNAAFFPEQTNITQSGTRQGVFVTIHDIISVLCGETLNALEGKIFPAGKNYRFVYGAFNANTGNFSDKCIADFPIRWKDFEIMIKELKRDGFAVPTVEAVINGLITNFLANETYWRSLNLNTQNLNVPNVILHFASHKNGSQEIIQASLIDIDKDTPVTTRSLREMGRQLVSLQDIENAIVGNPARIPIFKFGHSNSFNKGIELSHISDQSMKSVLIERANRNRIANERLPIPLRTALNSEVDFPLFLPIKGGWQCIGHPAWKPFRFFYLSTGFYILDAIYKITSFEHTLSAENFVSKLEFTYH